MQNHFLKESSPGFRISGYKKNNKTKVKWISSVAMLSLKCDVNKSKYGAFHWADVMLVIEKLKSKQLQKCLANIALTEEVDKQADDGIERNDHPENDRLNHLVSSPGHECNARHRQTDQQKREQHNHTQSLCEFLLFLGQGCWMAHPAILQGRRTPSVRPEKLICSFSYCS